MRFAAACLLLATLLVMGLPAHPAAAADPVLTADLAEFHPWLGPGNDLTATIHITNNGSNPLPLSGLQVHVEVFAGPDSRTTLENQFEGRNLTQVWADTEYLSLPELAPGASTDVQFDHRAPLSSITFFSTGADDRAYPLRFTVGAGGYTASPINTQLVYFTEALGVSHPLGLSLIIPLAAPSAFDAGGRETSQALEQAIAAGGRISRILDALESPAHAEVTATVAPTGQFLDDLARLAAGGFTRVNPDGTQPVGPNDPGALNAAATIQRLKTLAERPGIRLIASPYSGAPLPGLMGDGLSGDVTTQIAEGRAAVNAVLGFDPLPGWLLPSGGLLDEPTLNQLPVLGVHDVVVSSSSLQQSAPPILTPGAQVSLRGQSAGASRLAAPDQGSGLGGLVVDDVLSSRLLSQAGLGPLQVRQRFLAESATILLEQPAHARSVVALAPPDWDPDVSVINGILDALTPATGSPWMTGATPDGVIADASDTPVRFVAQSVSDALPQSPGKDYIDQLRSARGSLDDFIAIGPPASIINDLTGRLLVAEGAEWWGRGVATDRGKAFARSVSDAVKREFAKIQAPKDQLIVLTNRQATIPLALTSRTTYKVMVKVGLESDKLAFQGGAPCHSPALPAQTTCLTVSLSPGAQTLTVKATANFTGSFHVQVDLLTNTPAPARISTGALSIRSTAYNIVALGMMAAAALFILFSWARGGGRRRRSGEEPALPLAPLPGGPPAGAPVD